MSINLQKGQRISLSKDNQGLKKVIVGLGWDEAQPEPKKSGFFGRLMPSKVVNIDCDAFAILLQKDKLESKRDVVYFHNLKHSSGAVVHMGDNLTGAGEGDDEQIVIDLDRVPQQFDKIVIAVNIYQAYDRQQQFGMIKNAFIRLVDANTNKEMCIYNLSDNYEGKTAMLFGELYRKDGEWKFAAIGEGTSDGSIASFCSRYEQEIRK